MSSGPSRIEAATSRPPDGQTKDAKELDKHKSAVAVAPAAAEAAASVAAAAKIEEVVGGGGGASRPAIQSRMGGTALSNRKEKEKERDKGKEKGKSGETGGEKGRQSEVVRPKEKQNLAPPKNKQSARKSVI